MPTSLQAEPRTRKQPHAAPLRPDRLLRDSTLALRQMFDGRPPMATDMRTRISRGFNEDASGPVYVMARAIQVHGQEGRPLAETLRAIAFLRSVAVAHHDECHRPLRDAILAYDATDNREDAARMRAAFDDAHLAAHAEELEAEGTAALELAAKIRRHLHRRSA